MAEASLAEGALGDRGALASRGVSLIGGNGGVASVAGDGGSGGVHACNPTARDRQSQGEIRGIFLRNRLTCVAGRRTVVPRATANLKGSEMDEDFEAELYENDLEEFSDREAYEDMVADRDDGY